jgi:hypothetical protein
VGLFGATKPRIIRRASDCARHRRFRDGNCVVPEPNSTTCVQNCYCKKLSKTRAITVTQVSFLSHLTSTVRAQLAHRDFFLNFLFHFTLLITGTSPIVRLRPSYTFHIGCTTALSDMGVRPSGAAPLSHYGAITERTL